MTIKADRPLYGTKDGRVVGEGDPDASILLASREGREIPAHLAERYPVRAYMRDNPREKPQAPAEDEGGDEDKQRDTDASKRQRYADKQRRPQADK